MIQPIPFKIDVEYAVYSDRFRLVFDPDLYYVLQWYNFGEECWKNLYCFSTIAFRHMDYVMMNYYVATHPRSMFVNNVFCALATTEGTKVVFNNKLTIRENHRITHRTIANFEELKQVLMDECKIQVPDGVTQFPKIDFVERDQAQ